MTKPFAVDPLGNKIFMAETNAIEQQRETVDRLLLMIGEYMGWDDISDVFVSDMSRLGDFNLEPEEIEGLSASLGFAVDNKDYLHEIALRMRKPI